MLQQNIIFLENELKSKDKTIQLLLETQNALTNLLSNLKAKRSQPKASLNQQQQRHHQKYHHKQQKQQEQQQHQRQQSETLQPLHQSQKKSELPRTNAAKFSAPELN